MAAGLAAARREVKRAACHATVTR